MGANHDRTPEHRFLPTFAGLALVSALLWLSGCPRECRVDAECPSDDGIYRCSAEGTCEPLLPEAAKTCEAPGDCDGGRTCVAGSCRFAPSCQRFSDAAQLDFIAVCDGAVSRGSAAAQTLGCETSLTLQGLLGEDRVVSVGALSATLEGSEVPVDVAGVTCAAARYHSAKNGFALSGCAVVGATCDIGALRTGEGAACLVDAHCEAGQTCGSVVEAGDTKLGSCR